MATAMIDDATLTGWERLTRSDLCDNRPCERLESALQDAIAEIRRLREERNYALGKETDAKNELANRDYVEWRRAYDSDLGKRIEILSQNLSAHQAVVRELASVLDVDAWPEFANEGDMIAWVERKHAALTHPLVVAAWTEGQG